MRCIWAASSELSSFFCKNRVEKNVFTPLQECFSVFQDFLLRHSLLNSWFSVPSSLHCRCDSSGRAHLLDKAGFFCGAGEWQCSTRAVHLLQLALCAEVLPVLYYDEFWSSAGACWLLIKLVILVLELVICLVLANPIASQRKTLWMTVLMSGSVTVLLGVTNTLTSQMTSQLKVLMMIL